MWGRLLAGEPALVGVLAPLTSRATGSYDRFHTILSSGSSEGADVWSTHECCSNRASLSLVCAFGAQCLHHRRIGHPRVLEAWSESANTSALRISGLGARAWV